MNKSKRSAVRLYNPTVKKIQKEIKYHLQILFRSWYKQFANDGEFTSTASVARYYMYDLYKDHKLKFYHKSDTPGITFFSVNSGFVFKYFNNNIMSISDYKQEYETHKLFEEMRLPVPKIIDAFISKNERYCVIASHFVGFPIKYNARIYGTCKFEWFKNMAKSVLAFAKEGYIQFDINPTNFLVDENDEIIMIDYQMLNKCQDDPLTIVKRTFHNMFYFKIYNFENLSKVKPQYTPCIKTYNKGIEFLKEIQNIESLDKLEEYVT